MDEEDTARASTSRSKDHDSGNNDGKSCKLPPFFSMSKPLHSYCHSNSWDMGSSQVLPKFPTRKETDAVLPTPPTSKEPHSMLCSTNQQQPLIDLDWCDEEMKEPSSPIPSSKQPNSENRFDLWNDESKSLVSPFPINEQPCQFVGAGLGNMGNTCFLNATLQCITHTVPLVQKLCSAYHPTPCSYEKEGFCSFCALKEHVKESILKSGSVLLPARFSDNLSKISPDFRQGQQEDAHEFLRCLLDNLHKCSLDPQSKGKFSSIEEDSIVSQVFGGRLRSQLRCCNCGQCSDTFEPFLDLSLGIDKVDNLIDALESFTRVEKIGDSENVLTCESCKAQVSKEQQLKLDKTPDVIAFQLKRFTANDDSIEKIHKDVIYPSELDLKPFHSNPDSEVQLKYDLYGIVEHHGSPNCGHYVCTIRSSPTTWHLMNDSLVTPSTQQDALNQQAYILFYVRQGLSPWFACLLEAKEVLHLENNARASPVSVLQIIDRDRATSSGEASCSSSHDKLDKDEECSPCTASLVSDKVEKCPGDGAGKATLERPATPPPCPKRSLSNHHIIDVFHDEQFEDEETPLIPEVQVRPKEKKGTWRPAPQAVKDPHMDKNATRLLRSMHGSRRKGLVDCYVTQCEVAQGQRAPNWRTQPIDKKRRKLVVPVLQH